MSIQLDFVLLFYTDATLVKAILRKSSKHLNILFSDWLAGVPIFLYNSLHKIT